MKKQIWNRVIAAVLLMAMSGCGSRPKEETSAPVAGNAALTPQNGYARGTSGDVMQTHWFTIKAEEVSLTDAYADLTPAAEDRKLLVVPVTVTNTCDTDLSMYDVDFQVQWDDDSENAFTMPLTVEDAARFRDGMLEDSYVLAVNETRSGDLVFEVPADASGFAMVYQEVFETGETGDIFIITLTIK